MMNGAIRGDADCLFGLVREGAANDTGESAYVYFAKDAGGTLRKIASLSATTPVYTVNGLYGVWRANASYTVNGVGFDYLALRIMGGIGMTFFGTSDNDVPPTGYSLLNRGATWNTAKQRFGGGVSIAQTSEPATESACMQLYVDEADGKLKVKRQDGSVKEVVLAG